MSKHYFKPFRSLLLASTFVLLLVLASCASGPVPPPEGTNGSSTEGTPTTTSVTETVPPTETSCPADGSGRAAITANMALGNNANMIYMQSANTDDGHSIIQRYDTTTSTATEILNTTGKIADATLSNDGQWILFAHLLDTGETALKMVRLDGTGHQTLYCTPPRSGDFLSHNLLEIIWSPNQQRVAFIEGEYLSSPVKVLDLTTGAVQTVLVGPEVGAPYSAFPSMWLDNDRFYMTGFIPYSDAPPMNIYLLDINNGPNQTMSDLETIVEVGGFCYDYSLGSSKLYTSNCEYDPFGDMRTGPGKIESYDTNGQNRLTVLEDPTLAIDAIKVLTDNALLFTVKNTDNTSKNGLYLLEGSTPRELLLSTDQKVILRGNNSFAYGNSPQYGWTNVSRDNLHYSVLLQEQDTNKITLVVAPMASGSPTEVTSFNAEDYIELVGWTSY